MKSFYDIFTRLLTEDIAASTAFGSSATGNTGGQFPSQNSKGYNDGDNRPFDPAKMILGAKRKKNKVKFKIARRNRVSM